MAQLSLGRMLRRSLVHRKARSLSALVAMTVSAGVATALLTLYADLDAKLHKEFRSFGANVVVTAPAGGSALPADALARVQQAAGKDALVAEFGYAVATTDRGTSVVVAGVDFDAVIAEARRLLAAGDWPAATRYFYVAAILWLDRQGWIAFKKSKTNRDYIDELAPRARVQGSFRRLTADFEPIVYGGRPPQGSTIHDIATTVEGLLHEPAGASAN